MKIIPTNPWVKTVDEAKAIQQKLRPQVITEDQLETVKYVAGVDVGFEDNNKITKAAVVVLILNLFMCPLVIVSVYPQPSIM